MDTCLAENGIIAGHYTEIMIHLDFFGLIVAMSSCQ